MQTARATALAPLTASIFVGLGWITPASHVVAGQFDVQFGAGTIESLRRTDDAIDTQYIAEGRRLGDVLLTYRFPGKEWQSASTASLTPVAAPGQIPRRGAQNSEVRYEIGGDNAARLLELAVRFAVEDAAILWTIEVKNLSDQPLEIGDLALPFPMTSPLGRGGRGSSAKVLKHSLISGHGSFMFWARPSGGPYLMLIPQADAHLEYWEPPRRDANRVRGEPSPTADFRAFIHSVAAGENARRQGCQWRQPHTSLTLAPAGQVGEARSYGFKLRWADDYDAVREILVDEGRVDVHVVPGMTVPSDMSADVALRTSQTIDGIDAEFSDQTEIESLGARGDYQLYRVRFRRLGENRLTVRFGGDRQMGLEFFATEPVETLIKKRAAFLARSQHRDPTKWYRGLISDWNMESRTLLGPDNYDRISGFRIYAVTCDDPGLAKPAFLAAKNAEFPVPEEIAALDDYIEHFVWGGLQRTTDETHSYGVYGIQDWKRNRDSEDPGRNGRLHIWRCYDYPHVMLLYFSMYRIGQAFPHISTRLPPEEYLRRAAGTALAMFTIPRDVEGWSADRTGFYNELVIVDLIDALEDAAMHHEAATLRKHWERKVRVFAAEKPDLFRSEYPFDSTGFESTHAMARYAVLHAEGAGDLADGESLAVSAEAARTFMDAQLAANIFCRGSIEPAYYYLGSDYRAGAGNGYTLSYMSQMGGWSILDYGLHFANEPAQYLRLGYASYLSAWALVNSGTPEENYGYWYPGAANDGAAGGGFEPAPFGRTWLDQPHHRGAWYYACESDLGFSGALRSAATVLADDPIFGRFCFGGEWSLGNDGRLSIIPKDGLRRRFHAMLDAGRLHLEVEGVRFVADQPIVVPPNLAAIQFQLESDDPSRHLAKIRLAAPVGRYSVRANGRDNGAIELDGRRYVELDVTIPAGKRPVNVAITRLDASALE